MAREIRSRCAAPSASSSVAFRKLLGVDSPLRRLRLARIADRLCIDDPVQPRHLIRRRTDVRRGDIFLKTGDGGGSRNGNNVLISAKQPGESELGQGAIRLLSEDLIFDQQQPIPRKMRLLGARHVAPDIPLGKIFRIHRTPRQKARARDEKATTAAPISGLRVHKE